MARGKESAAPRHAARRTWATRATERSRRPPWEAIDAGRVAPGGKERRGRGRREYGRRRGGAGETRRRRGPESRRQGAEGSRGHSRAASKSHGPHRPGHRLPEAGPTRPGTPAGLCLPATASRQGNPAVRADLLESPMSAAPRHTGARTGPARPVGNVAGILTASSDGLGSDAHALRLPAVPYEQTRGLGQGEWRGAMELGRARPRGQARGEDVTQDPGHSRLQGNGQDCPPWRERSGGAWNSATRDPGTMI